MSADSKLPHQSTAAKQKRDGKVVPMARQVKKQGSLEDFILAVLPKPSFDFTFENHGSICLLRPLNDSARAWMDEHLPMDTPETQFWGDAIVIEPRYAADVLRGISNDGLSVGGAA
jgi:hypothetical protein